MTAAAVSSSSGWFEVWSVLVAAVGAFLAFGSLATQLREAYWSRPVIVLDASITSSPEGWYLTVVVTNVGERAVTITHSGWWFGQGTHWEDVIEANKTVKLPHRLEPHDAITFEGQISLDEAEWTRANWGLYRRASSYYGDSLGAWRNDELPNHFQYADPFVMVVRRPQNRIVRSARAAARTVARKLTSRSAWLLVRSSWWRFARHGAPKGHARVWGEPQVIWEPIEQL